MERLETKSDSEIVSGASNSPVIPISSKDKLRQMVQEYRRLLDYAACFRTQQRVQRDDYSFNF